LETLISTATFSTISAFVIITTSLGICWYIYDYQAQKLCLLREPL
jgi:hypothetical protein